VSRVVEGSGADPAVRAARDSAARALKRSEGTDTRADRILQRGFGPSFATFGTALALLSLPLALLSPLLFPGVGKPNGLGGIVGIVEIWLFFAMAAGIPATLILGARALVLDRASTELASAVVENLLVSPDPVRVRAGAFLRDVSGRVDLARAGTAALRRALAWATGADDPGGERAVRNSLAGTPAMGDALDADMLSALIPEAVGDIYAVMRAEAFLIGWNPGSDERVALSLGLRTASLAMLTGQARDSEFLDDLRRLRQVADGIVERSNERFPDPVLPAPSPSDSVRLGMKIALGDGVRV
jgi:hypothetical protein